MKVQAIKTGFYAGMLRDSGDIFDAKDGAKAKWFAPTKAAETTKPVRKKRSEPETFSEVAHQDADSVVPEGGGADLV